MIAFCPHIRQFLLFHMIPNRINTEKIKLLCIDRSWFLGHQRVFIVQQEAAGLFIVYINGTLPYSCWIPFLLSCIRWLIRILRNGPGFAKLRQPRNAILSTEYLHTAAGNAPFICGLGD